MTHLERIKAAEVACRAAWTCALEHPSMDNERAYAKACEHRDDLLRLHGAALVAGCEALRVLLQQVEFCPCCEDSLEIVTEPLADARDQGYAALAPLTKEAPDDRA